jgi:hypothetical protein
MRASEEEEEDAACGALAFADVALRAGSDASLHLAHRGVLAAHSPVLRAALALLPPCSACSAPHPLPRLTLPGRCGADVAALLSYVYRRERMSASDNVPVFLSLARELDIPRMAADAEECLLAEAAAGTILPVPLRAEAPPAWLERRCARNGGGGGGGGAMRRAVRGWVALLALSAEYELRRFGRVAQRRLEALPPADARAIAEAQAAAASASQSGTAAAAEAAEAQHTPRANARCCAAAGTQTET